MNEDRLLGQLSLMLKLRACLRDQTYRRGLELVEAEIGRLHVELESAKEGESDAQP